MRRRIPKKEIARSPRMKRKKPLLLRLQHRKLAVEDSLLRNLQQRRKNKTPPPNLLSAARLQGARSSNKNQCKSLWKMTLWKKTQKIWWGVVGVLARRPREPSDVAPSLNKHLTCNHRYSRFRLRRKPSRGPLGKRKKKKKRKSQYFGRNSQKLISLCKRRRLGRLFLQSLSHWWIIKTSCSRRLNLKWQGIWIT